MTGSPFNQALLERFARKPEGFAEFREESWNRFIRMGLPEKKGAFQYFPLSQLYGTSFETQTSSGAAGEENTLVFIDGEFRPDLVAPERAKRSRHSTLGRSAALLPQHPFPQAISAASQEKDPFALLNLSLHMRGAFVFIPPKALIKQPIRSIHYMSRPCFPRVQLFVGAKAQVEWISTVVQETRQPLWASLVFDAALDEGAKLHLTQTYSRRSGEFSFRRGEGRFKEAKFTSVSVHRGSRALRQDYKMHLIGPEAEVELSGLALLQNNLQSHVHVLMEHEAPHCTSRQHFKGVYAITASRASKERFMSTPKRRRPRPTSSTTICF